MNGPRWRSRLRGEVRYAVAQTRHLGVMLGYRIRPYDMHLDARRWCWQRSGRQRSHDAIAASPALLAAIERHAATCQQHAEPGTILAAWQQIARIVGREETSPASVVDAVAYLAEQAAARSAAAGSNLQDAGDVEPIADLVERSSFGTPAACAARARVSDERAAELLARVNATGACRRPDCPARKDSA